MDWPKALTDYRRRHRLTQGALAEMLNVDPTTVSRWERERDQPALGILRRLRSLVIPTSSDVARASRLLMDTSDAIAVLFDDKYRLLHSSPKHRALLRLDASELYGSLFYRIQSQSQAAPTVATPSESITCPDCGLILNITRDATGTTLVYDFRDWKRRCKHPHLGDPAWCLLEQGTLLLVRDTAFSRVPRPCAARRAARKTIGTAGRHRC
jgi:transcriptional regulator with XRE-family HTH domain